MLKNYPKAKIILKLTIDETTNLKPLKVNIREYLSLEPKTALSIEM